MENNRMFLEEWLKDSANEINEITLPVNNKWKRWSLNLAQICGLLFGIILVVIGGSVYTGETEVKETAFFAAIMLIVSLSLLFLSKSYSHYILDLKQRRLVLYRKFFSQFPSGAWEFDDFLGITTDGERREGRGASWWEYFAVIVVKNGKSIRVSDYKAPFLLTDEKTAKDYFSECEQAGQKLAKALEVSFVEGKPEHSLKLERNENGEFVISHKRRSSTPFRLFMAILIAVIFAVALWQIMR